MFFTYILQSLKSGKLYIGQTNNIQKRLSKHNENEVKSTKNRGPWKIIHFEIFATRAEA